MTDATRGVYTAAANRDDRALQATFSRKPQPVGFSRQSFRPVSQTCLAARTISSAADWHFSFLHICFL
jgi:hypothetical protein